MDPVTIQNTEYHLEEAHSFTYRVRKLSIMVSPTRSLSVCRLKEKPGTPACAPQLSVCWAVSCAASPWNFYFSVKSFRFVYLKIQFPELCLLHCCHSLNSLSPDKGGKVWLWSPREPRCQLPQEPWEVHVRAGIRDRGDQRPLQTLQEPFRFSYLKGLWCQRIVCWTPLCYQFKMYLWFKLAESGFKIPSFWPVWVRMFSVPGLHHRPC